MQSLNKHQQKMEEWRTAKREEAGRGDIFLMREAKDLSGKDGDQVTKSSSLSSSLHIGSE